ncbi:MAG: STAS domain-containing protein [Chloroflexota bacterium]
MAHLSSIDLENAMAAHDIPMHIVERTGTGPHAEIRMYPLNAAAQIGYGDFREQQGLLLEDYVSEPEFIPFFRNVYAPVLENGVEQTTYEIAFPIPDGSIHDFSATVYRISWSPEQAQALVITQDVTEQKRAERELKITQQRLQSIINNIPMILFGINTEGIFTLSEGRGLIDLGLQPGQVVGLPVATVYQDVPEITGDVEKAMKGEEFTTSHQVGDTYFETWYTPMHDQNGQLLGTIGVSIDVTARVRAEQEQHQLQEQIINTQASALAELTTPIIPISDTIVVMPLIGMIDSLRAQQIMDALLEGVTQQGAEIAILDITGMSVVDTQIANALIQVAQAVQLLGARVVLTGIRPEIAQTIVGLGINLHGIATHSTLQEGIALALAKRVISSK